MKCPNCQREIKPTEIEVELNERDMKILNTRKELTLVTKFGQLIMKKED